MGLFRFTNSLLLLPLLLKVSALAGVVTCTQQGNNTGGGVRFASSGVKVKNERTAGRL
jgi:hypothetical protein